MTMENNNNSTSSSPSLQLQQQQQTLLGNDVDRLSDSNSSSSVVDTDDSFLRPPSSLSSALALATMDDDISDTNSTSSLTDSIAPMSTLSSSSSTTTTTTSSLSTKLELDLATGDSAPKPKIDITLVGGGGGKPMQHSTGGIITTPVGGSESKRVDSVRSSSLEKIIHNSNRPHGHTRTHSTNATPTATQPKDKDNGAPKKRTKLEEMIMATESGNTIFLGLAIKQKPIISLSYELPGKSTFLHVACSSLKITSVMFVLEAAGMLLNAQNTKGRTPLYVCCEAGFFHAANYLLKCGASPMLADYHKWTPLHRLSSKTPKTTTPAPSLAPASAATPDSKRVGGTSGGPSDKVGFTKELQLEAATKILSINPSIIAAKTSSNQTPLHIAISNGNYHLCKLYLQHSTAQSLLVKDDNGNSPLHLVAYTVRSKTFAQSILDKLADSLSGEQLMDYIDEINNVCASALQLSMKRDNQELCRLIIRYRSMAESKILKEYFSDLNALNPSEATRLPLDKISYLESPFRSSHFGILFRKIITIIKQHYAINMTHQNANILLTRTKDTIKKFFDWLDNNVMDTNYIRYYKETLFSQTYDTIIHLYHEVYKSRDLFTQQRIAMYIDLSYSELDISESSWEQNVEAFPRALEIMKRLPEKRTPSDKIDGLNEATSQIVRMDANDLTPMFMFLLIKSDLKNMASEYQFMDDFKETPEQEQYLVLLQGSFDYLETLNYTLRNSMNQVMSLSGIVDRTIDNALSLCDEFQNAGVGGADMVEDLDEGLRIQDEMVLLLMMVSKLANRMSNDIIYLPLKWSDIVMKSYHFKAIVERLGVRLDQSLELLITTSSPIQEFDQTAPSPADANTIIKKKGEICIILEHPYPQMVYQVIEESLRKALNEHK
ncbi:hypothetical protein SAMD00019534_124140 [Acytostelium subglobosum LB1]|uniref:hypothetical protein n=1 Tax=Acytostelium subglobosum LB1 TaxID=1410327 RepID=UPI000644827E|nr:hypothetical protein SAMD00019534_124140 [Acytostelium subglobosum LB1]GAM29238.1 hypothetical protein SAMD00019534_124140 [Acytostelium subglobosum LB1]|eukprot:XP_012747812.1 hypothetical protein SAMD00019534_124140 [Acytostelium subglobosum LB1]